MQFFKVANTTSLPVSGHRSFSKGRGEWGTEPLVAICNLTTRFTFSHFADAFIERDLQLRNT